MYAFTNLVTTVRKANCPTGILRIYSFKLKFVINSVLKVCILLIVSKTFKAKC